MHLKLNTASSFVIILLVPQCHSLVTTVEPRFNYLRYNIPGMTINIRLPSKSCSKMYGAEPRYNDFWYNDIPGLMMGLSLTECKIFLVIMIKSISQTTGNENFSNEQNNAQT